MTVDRCQPVRHAHQRQWVGSRSANNEYPKKKMYDAGKKNKNMHGQMGTLQPKNLQNRQIR